MSSRERSIQRKNWKKNSQTYRDKKAQLRKNLTKVLDETPSPSTGSSLEAVIQNNDERRDLVAAQRRRQLRRRRAILYTKMAILRKKLKEEIRKKEIS